MRRTLGLIRKFIARTTHAIARWIAALNHEVGNDAVKNRAVVKLVVALLAADGVGPLPFTLGELDKVFYRLGRVFFEEAADDLTFTGVNDGIGSWITGHEELLVLVSFYWGMGGAAGALAGATGAGTAGAGGKG